jgi:hypothetical protein
MSELEEKLNAMMSNPQLMQQIAAMAQNMGQNTQQPHHQDDTFIPPPPADPQNIQAIVQAVGQNTVDTHQQALLQALGPYLNASRIQKLERAVRVAKMAGAASVFLNSGGLQMFQGR